MIVDIKFYEARASAKILMYIDIYAFLFAKKKVDSSEKSTLRFSQINGIKDE